MDETDITTEDLFRKSLEHRPSHGRPPRTVTYRCTPGHFYTLESRV